MMVKEWSNAMAGTGKQVLQLYHARHQFRRSKGIGKQK
jgi:hypothetical protein